MKKSLVLVCVSFLLTGCMGFFGPSGVPEGCENKSEQFMKDDCYLDRAVKEHDREACPQIFDMNKRASCALEIAVGQLDIEACDLLDGYRQEKCITDFSQQGFANGVSDCQQHEDVDTCLAHQAEVRQNPNYCNRSSDYRACIEALIKTAPADRLPCMNVESEDRVACVLEMASILEDPSFCKSLELEDEVKTCEEAMKDADNNAAAMYANMICQLANPAAWEGLFDDKTTEEIAADEAQTLRLYTEFGYSGEADARVDLEKVWGEESFKKLVIESVARDCSENVSIAGLSVDEFLNQPVAEALGN